MAKRFKARGGSLGGLNRPLTFWGMEEEKGIPADNSRVPDKPCSCCGSVTFWAWLGEVQYGWTCAVCIPPIRTDNRVLLSILKKPVRRVPGWY